MPTHRVLSHWSAGCSLEMGPQGQGRTACASWRAHGSQHFLTPIARHASDDSPVSQKVTVQLRAFTHRPAPRQGR